ncbi:MAG: amidophosphoribosyltransferase [Desulfovibrionaceae bacterium]|nr:amidophosphoribosyltransferase [Desulfovibrionaceae bacterium]
MSLIGIYNHPKAAKMAYFGLYAQQHRGQQSAGIVSRRPPKREGEVLQICEHLGLGLVPDVFPEEILNRLRGSRAIGHVLYSRSGSPSLRDAEPFRIQHRGIDLSVAHNGALLNAKSLRLRMEKLGAIFHTATDSELFAHLIIDAMEKGDKLPEAVAAACKEVRGAFSLLVLGNDQMIAVRDPLGIKPLSIARVEKTDTWVLASETCAFDLLEAQKVRSVRPGEMVVIEADGALASPTLTSIQWADSPGCKHCVFELVYFARPDSVVFGEEVYSCRKRMGIQAAREAPCEADCVMPLPDSGVYFALGYAQGAGLPYEHAMIRNHYVGRTFIQPTQEMRSFDVRIKLNPVSGFIRGRRVVIADDSIVRGTTVRGRTSHLREAGAREVHFRVSSPPVKFPCLYGVDFPSREELIAVHKTNEEIREYIGLDSLHHLTLEGLKAILEKPEDFCYACFDGNYPVPPNDEEEAAAARGLRIEQPED